MGEIYFPSCNFTSLAPRAAKAIAGYLRQRMPRAACCRFDKLEYAEGSTGLYVCQACRETLEARAGGKYMLKHLAQYLLEDPLFPWPDYSGMTATVQDCWRDREHPEVFSAVREALRRMNVEIVEMEEREEKSVYCGDLHFEPKKPENAELLRRYGGEMLRLPQEAKLSVLREQAEKYPCDTVVTCCNRCTSCIRAVGVRAIHLLELAAGTV